MMSISNDTEKMSPAMCLLQHKFCVDKPVLCQLLSSKTSENQMQDKAMCLCITVYYTRVTHRTVLSVCSKLKNFTMSNTENREIGGSPSNKLCPGIFYFRMEEKEKIVFDVRIFFSAVFSPLCHTRKKDQGR